MEHVLLESSGHLLSTTRRGRYPVTPVRGLRNWLGPDQASDVWDSTSPCARGLRTSTLSLLANPPRSFNTSPLPLGYRTMRARPVSAHYQLSKSTRLSLYAGTASAELGKRRWRGQSIVKSRPCLPHSRYHCCITFFRAYAERRQYPALDLHPRIPVMRFCWYEITTVPETNVQLEIWRYNTAE